jgi:hypothetical protein
MLLVLVYNNKSEEELEKGLVDDRQQLSDRQQHCVPSQSILQPCQWQT